LVKYVCIVFRFRKASSGCVLTFLRAIRHVCCRLSTLELWRLCFAKPVWEVVCLDAGSRAVTSPGLREADLRVKLDSARQVLSSPVSEKTCWILEVPECIVPLLRGGTILRKIVWTFDILGKSCVGKCRSQQTGIGVGPRSCAGTLQVMRK
jgi:hypothetical protein